MRNDKALGARHLSRFRYRTYLRLALIGVAVVSLGLAACGRKGPLDPPPGASLANETQPDIPGLMNNRTAAPIGGQTQGDNPGVGADGRPQASTGPKKRIPLDVLLN